MDDIIINLFSIVFTLSFGIAFLSWGIYQVKTGKMVAKNTKNPIDEPKQVGMLFIMLSLAAFFITFVQLKIILSLTLGADFVILCYILGLSEFSFLLAAAIYGFKNHRIFGIKNTGSLKKLSEKFSSIFNFSLVLISLGILILYIPMTTTFLSIDNLAFINNCFPIGMTIITVSVLSVALISCIISIKATKK